MPGSADPGHRRPAAVAAGKFRPERHAEGVAQVVVFKLRLRQAQFLPLVEAQRAGKAAEQQRQQCGEPLGIGAGRFPARDGALDIVVAEAPAGGGAGARRHQRAEQGAGAERLLGQVQRIGGMQAALPGVAVDPLAGARLARQFAQQHPAAILVRDLAEPGQQARRYRHAPCRGYAAEGRTAWPGCRKADRPHRRIAAQLRVVHQEIDGVEPEAVDPRSSQNRAVSSSSATTAGWRRFSVGWLDRKWCR